MNMQATGRVCAKLKDDPNKESAADSRQLTCIHTKNSKNISIVILRNMTSLPLCLKETGSLGQKPR